VLFIVLSLIGIDLSGVGKRQAPLAYEFFFKKLQITQGLSRSFKMAKFEIEYGIRLPLQLWLYQNCSK